MIYNLYKWLEADGWLSEHGMGFFRVIDYITFRAVCAIIFSFLFVIVLGRPTIRRLLRMKIGDSPEFYRQDLNQLMKSKVNTPTMGGILISGAILASTLLLGDLGSFYIHMALVCLIWLSILGMFDDWLKLTSARRRPLPRRSAARAFRATTPVPSMRCPEKPWPRRLWTQPGSPSEGSGFPTWSFRWAGPTPLP